jgi:hypothetical protein
MIGSSHSDSNTLEHFGVVRGEPELQSVLDVEMVPSEMVPLEIVPMTPYFVQKTAKMLAEVSVDHPGYVEVIDEDCALFAYA